MRLSAVQVPGAEERQYGALLGTPQQVGQDLFSLAALAGYGEQTWVHGVGDGASWIAQQVGEVFPRHHYLLDRYHLLEHLYEGAAGLKEQTPQGRAEWVAEQLARIDGGQVKEVIATCQVQGGGQAEHPCFGLARYLENQGDHLDYAFARAHGLPLGSGVVEGGHRHVIQQRLKLPGAWWREETVNPMLALRILRVNGWWEGFWN